MKEGFVKYQILIVDDMKVNFLAISKLLAPYPFECHFEGQPEKVLAAAQALKPDAILLDFEMPGLDGPEVCQLLKKDMITAEIPVLFVTAQTGEAEIARAFEAGADDYVLKPARVKELLARLNRSLINRELQKELGARIEDQTMLTRILSHDINNLLTIAMSGTAGLARTLPLISEAAQAEELNKYTQRISESLKRIAELVMNVRQLQSIEDHKLVLDITAVDLMKTLAEVNKIFSDKLLAKQLEFEMTLSSTHSECMIMAESTSLLHSVLSNLLSNSIKFSKAGKKISAAVRVEENTVTLEWVDQGVGMSEDMLTKLFSKTEKTSRPGTENEKGTGFGMPIVKRYVELFGGNIQVSSKPIELFPEQSGTTFTLQFKAASKP